MSHPSKVKGTRWESEVAAYLGTRRLGSIHGNKDQGDLDDDLFVIECKDEQRITLAQYMEELEAELMNDDLKDWAVAIVKRRRKNVKDAYAVMPLWLFREVKKALQEVEDAR